MVTELAKGKKVSQAQKISQEDVLKALGGLPEESEHCALLAANTLKAAIRDYLVIKKEPWKRLIASTNEHDWRQQLMAKEKVLCPFSGQLCKECPLYRGRHYYLCFNKSYRGTWKRGRSRR